MQDNTLLCTFLKKMMGFIMRQVKKLSCGISEMLLSCVQGGSPCNRSPPELLLLSLCDFTECSIHVWSAT